MIFEIAIAITYDAPHASKRRSLYVNRSLREEAAIRLICGCGLYSTARAAHRVEYNPLLWVWYTLVG